jgi:hypothetical protein
VLVGQDDLNRYQKGKTELWISGCGLWTGFTAHDCFPREGRSTLLSRLQGALLKDHADDEVQDNKEDQHAIHDQVYPYVGFVLFIHIAQFFEHNRNELKLLHPVYDY